MNRYNPEALSSRYVAVVFVVFDKGPEDDEPVVDHVFEDRDDAQHAVDEIHRLSGNTHAAYYVEYGVRARGSR